ncbi:hypothetical protein [Phormidium sp. CCY1219]|uniref:hypothetical protein n=1 Tax=Phormidium sp. CCY1219 TaxID=2886104 RepID=UPI002D1F6704|nr:hypothetical protein [Phormidium sp. CCY1219]MEB3831765.1 hypothetical protein [Phormidium sp. CCY1219]
MMDGKKERHQSEEIKNLIEDVVGKMHKAGKSFGWIAMWMVLTETEVKDAFSRYQQRRGGKPTDSNVC